MTSSITELTKTHLVGRTPVCWIGEPFASGGRGFWAKLEGANPGGLKDRAALHIVRRARARGQLAPGAMIVESTSGTSGLGLALAGIVYGHPVTVVSDPGMEAIIETLLVSYGVRVETVLRAHPSGGWQHARLDRVAQLMARHPGAYCPDQYSNPDNVEAYAGLADELAERLGRIDVLVCSVGTGGHSAGIARRLRLRHPALRLVGVDSIGSTIFGQPARPRLMRGLGSSIHPRNVAHDAFDEVHWVAPHEAVWASRTLAHTHYATGGWSVGAVTVVASWYARTTPSGVRVAAVFPDGPARYHTTVFDDAYCAEHDLLGRPPAAEPDEVKDSGEAEVTRWTRMVMPYLAGHLADGSPALLVASVMTGFAGALFNPAVHAYLAHGSGERRVEAFALFNVFCQAGILLGPLIGVALLSVDFRLVCVVAAGVFAALTLLQLSALPPFRDEERRGGVRADWGRVVANRPFRMFALAMVGSYVLSFQIYLALPLALGDDGAVSALFVVSALVALLGQMRVTDWARGRWTTSQAMARGLGLMGLAFVPLIPYGVAGAPVPLAAALACTALLTLGTVLAYPFEMDTVVALSGGHRVATHYGFYNTVAGLGVAAGNLAVGRLLDLGPAWAWTTLALTGAASAVAVRRLDRELGGHRAGVTVSSG
ncbi:pyridoxal-phosphate dependent enzyme [Nonomuraea aridisoli]|nr:pyridoxal-phosphate dependent enzyme [Nonomuraea aridisoli]